MLIKIIQDIITTMELESQLPLSKVKILDLTVNVPGPFCSTILGDMGAHVTKVEPPGGDPLRHSLGTWASINRGKRSIAIDLKTPEGHEILARLASGVDMILEGWRPGVAKRLSADYETLRQSNHGVVYCSISGFGQTGPWVYRPGHDINYMALSGYLSIQAQIEGQPAPPALLFSDLISGLYAAISSLAALVGRGATGTGTYIDLSMTDAMLSLMGLEIGKMSEPSEKGKKPNVTFIPHYGLFQCADDVWISLGIVHEDHFWKCFCAVAGLDDMAEMDFMTRLHCAATIEEKLRVTFKQRLAIDWEQELLGADVPVAIVNDIDDVMQLPHFKERGLINLIKGRPFVSQPAKFAAYGATFGGTAPHLGEHSESILLDLGYNSTEIMALKNKGILGNV